MQSLRFQRFNESPWRSIVFVVAGLYACSFQDFDYLKAGDRGSGGASAATAGVSGRPDGGALGAAGSSDAGQGGANDELIGGSGGDASGALAGSAGEPEESAGAGGAPDPIESAGGAGGTMGTAGSGGAPAQKELLNGGFEQNLVGWVVDPPEARQIHSCPTGTEGVDREYVKTQAGTVGGDDATSKEGTLVLATYHDCNVYELSVYQTLTGLEDGTYTLKGWFSSDRSQGAYLFARNCDGTGQEVRQAIPVPCNDTGVGNTWDWAEIAFPGIKVAGGTCQIGFHVSAIGKDWLNADGFTFKKDSETTEP